MAISGCPTPTRTSPSMSATTTPTWASASALRSPPIRAGCSRDRAARTGATRGLSGRCRSTSRPKSRGFLRTRALRPPRPPKRPRPEARSCVELNPGRETPRPDQNGRPAKAPRVGAFFLSRAPAGLRSIRGDRAPRTRRLIRPLPHPLSVGPVLCCLRAAAHAHHSPLRLAARSSL